VIKPRRNRERKNTEIQRGGERKEKVKRKTERGKD
jgi:hypothetical protein